MKKALFTLVVLFATVSQLFAQGHHRVSGYYRSNGTYVQPHYRTNPNNTINDNWSTAPNVNPFTGRVGTVAPTTYSNSSSYSMPTLPSYTPPAPSYPVYTPTYSAPSYPTNSSSYSSYPTIPPVYSVVQYNGRVYVVKN